MADAILRGIDLGCISYAELHFGSDQTIWDKLILKKDPIIEKKMRMIMNPQSYFCMVDSVDEADFIVKSKFRGIDPWIASEPQEYEKEKRIISKGWLIKVFPE